MQVHNVLYLLKISPPGKQIMSSGKLQSNSIGNGLDSSEEKQNKHAFSLAGCSCVVWGMRSCRAYAIEVQSRRWCHWIKFAILNDCKRQSYPYIVECRVHVQNKRNYKSIRFITLTSLIPWPREIWQIWLGKRYCIVVRQSLWLPDIPWLVF